MRSNLGAGPGSAGAVQQQVQAAMGQAKDAAEANKAEAEQVVGAVKSRMAAT